MSKCLFCSVNDANIEDMICSKCDQKLGTTVFVQDRTENVNEFHKGETCWISCEPLLCQEGFCIRCDIYVQWKKK